MLLCAVTRPWPRRLDGRPPSSRCCSPLVMAMLARAARARSVGSRVRDGSTLSRRSTRRPALPALNTARLLRRDSRSLACGRDGSTAARRRVAADRRSSRQRSRALLAPARSAAAFATARHSAAARCGGLRLLRWTRHISRAVLLCAVTRAWARRLDGRPPSGRCCSPLVAAMLARAARARSVGRRVRAGSTRSRRSTRRPAPPVLNTARFLRRASLRGHTPVTATARRPPPSSRCCSPLVAATLARAARARSVGRRVRDRSALSRRSTRRPALPALNAARVLRRASLRGHAPVAATARRPPAVVSLLLVARRGHARCSRPLGRPPPRSRRLDTQPPLGVPACASCVERGTSFAPYFSAWSHTRDRDRSTADRR